MKLTDLDPRWFTFDGQRAGFVFKCPCCPGGLTYLTCKTVAKDALEQIDEIVVQHPDLDPTEICPGREPFCWTITGDDFATLSVTPSIDASPAGHWHGSITQGEIR